jgi:cyclic pyranopterin phosphate synthase
MIAWAHARGCDMTLIETMPMGEIDVDRSDQFLSLGRSGDAGVVLDA